MADDKDMAHTDPKSMAERLGQCQFGPGDAAIIMGVPRDQFEEGPLLEALVRGRLRAQAKVRAAVLAQAIDGDPASVKEFQRLAAESAFAIE
jgi:hypothetical protein